MAAAAWLFGALLLTASGPRSVSALSFVSPNGSYAGQIDTPPNLSPSCAATFSEAVVCDPILWQVAQNALPSPDTIDLMCTTPSCASSLEALRELQIAQCADTDNITVGYYVFPATYVVDLLLDTYKWACLTDTAGDHCLALLMMEQANASNDEPPLDLCPSACTFRMLQARLNSPLGYYDGLASHYSSLTSSCQVTSYPVTSPARYRLGTTTIPLPTLTDRIPIPSYTCEAQYTIKKSDNCRSISRAKQVSTFSLLYSNKLPMFCARFPAAGTEICIPQQCNTYKVMPIDTCQRVAKSHGLTVRELIELNPNLKSHCGNLRSFTGHMICLSPPGVVSTTARPQPTTTSHFTNPCLSPGAPSTCFTTSWETPESDIPWPTDTYTGSPSATTTEPAFPEWTDPASLPRAPGTRENCTRYDIYDDFYDVHDLQTRFGSANACWWKANFWGATHEQLMEWNPSLSYDVADRSTWNSCQFKEGYSYCVEA
ncbi:uncharacterized protein B0H64DRAFT_249422 [Chaetomium fimeti]|uniref:LysM domain-containing protein n=1 Tax=Chaetomium fimeti TaxID=1854472 RepID=A0AAE0H813_9PEZI|nr:hypothetical protein B0H64DRAFT_249422 [Chaetomium fimeti]